MDPLVMALALHARRGLGDPDREQMAAAVNALANRPDCLLITDERGGIAGQLVTLPGTTTRIVQEVAWWSPAGQGLALLAECEAWAEAQGAAAIRVSTRPGAKLRGFQAHSTVHQKVF